MLRANLSKRITRKVRELPSICGSFIISVPTVDAKLTNAYHRAKEAHRAKLPPLSDKDHAIVAAVDRDGFHVTSLDDIDVPGSAAMLAAGQRLAAHYADLNKNGGMHNLDAFQASDKDVLQNKEIFEWGLNERLLRIAETYLGLPVAFDGINIFYTKADGREVAARKWHVDGEDRRMLKIAVYFNDVDEDGGPLQLLKPDLPARNFLEKFRAPVYTQENLEAQVPNLSRDNIATCTGPKGTVIFCDTARKYHRGKPAVARDRCAVFFNYFSRPPLRPFYCERSTLSRAQFRSLAEGLSPLQRDSLLWRESQPLIARILPPAPIA